MCEEEGHAFLRDVIRHKGARVEADRLAADEYEVEEVDFVVDPMAQTSVLGNLILLGRPPLLSTFPTSPSLSSLLARYTLSLSLARSSSLSVLEDRLDAHIASVSLLPRALEKFGAQPLGRREVIRKIGEIMTLRMAVNTRGGGLEETPEFFWSEPELEDYFDSVAKEFEIKERVDLLNKKIDYAQEIQNTLRALLTEASGHRMELIIIALIAVEVVFVSYNWKWRWTSAVGFANDQPSQLHRSALDPTDTQVLIREGPELWQHFAYPVIQAIHNLIHPASRAGADSDAEQQPRRLRVSAPAPAPQLEPVAVDQPRLV